MTNVKRKTKAGLSTTLRMTNVKIKTKAGPSTSLRMTNVKRKTKAGPSTTLRMTSKSGRMTSKSRAAGRYKLDVDRNRLAQERFLWSEFRVGFLCGG
jgi:hypothetical protein